MENPLQELYEILEYYERLNTRLTKFGEIQKQLEYQRSYELKTLQKHEITHKHKSRNSR